MFNAPSGGGGSGGGGYYGGGGGGAGGFVSTPTAGAGGGGGSSLLPPGATISLADQGAAASVRIMYEIPDSAIDSGPQGFVQETVPTFGFSGDGATSFECSLDEAPFAGCTSPLTLPEPLDDGRHTFEVRAFNDQGNFDPTPARRTFTVDTVKPNTRVKSAPKSTRKRRAKIRFEAGEPASFRCSANGRRARPCSSAYRPTLDKGRNVFRIAATDRAGNKEAKPAKVVIRRVE